MTVESTHRLGTFCFAVMEVCHVVPILRVDVLCLVVLHDGLEPLHAGTPSADGFDGRSQLLQFRLELGGLSPRSDPVRSCPLGRRRQSSGGTSPRLWCGFCHTSG